MSSIIKVATLVLCKGCGLHGKLAFPDGTTSRNFVTREDALEEVKLAFVMQKIIEFEVRYLTDQILESDIQPDSVMGTFKKVALKKVEEKEEESDTAPTSAASLSDCPQYSPPPAPPRGRILH